MTPILYVPVSFKEVWTETVYCIHVNPYWKTQDFLDEVKNHIRDLGRTEDFEIVEAGQDTWILEGLPAELAPSVQYSNRKIKDIWGKSMNVAFYLRRKNFDYQGMRQTEQTEQTDRDVENECPICYEVSSTLQERYSECSHRVCNNCYNLCCLQGYFICPLCRRQ